MENENVPKQFKINQNILKMLSSIEHANINNQWKCHVPTVVWFKVTPKIQIQFCENSILRKCSLFSLIFLLFFFSLLKMTGNFTFWPPQCTNDVHFPIEQDTEVENRNIISTTYRVHRHKKKFKNLKKKTRIIVKSTLFHSESKKIKKNTHHCKINTFIVSLRI